MPRSRSTASRPSRPKRASAAPSLVRQTDSVGTSTHSWDHAVIDAVQRAKDEAPRPIAVEVAKLWAELDGGSRIGRYHAAVKVAYRQPLRAPSSRRPRRAIP